MTKIIDRVTIVTGASRGIGRAVAEQLAEAGCMVVAAARAQHAEETVATILASGGRAELASLDVTEPDAVRNLVSDVVKRLGRIDVLVANAGILLSQVIEIKHLSDRRFVIIDAAMNDFLRPALYDAWHPIDPVCEAPVDAKREIVDIVGPVCESGDILGRGRAMSFLAPGDLVAIAVNGKVQLAPSAEKKIRGCLVKTGCA